MKPPASPGAPTLRSAAAAHEAARPALPVSRLLDGTHGRPRVLVFGGGSTADGGQSLHRQLSVLQAFEVQGVGAQPDDNSSDAVPPASLRNETSFQPRSAATAWARGLWPGHHGNLLGPTRRERRRIEALARAFDPDVFLCQSGETALRILPVAESLRRPVIVHFSSADRVDNGAIHRWCWQRCGARIAEAIVSRSDQARQLAELGIPSDRIFRIPCGAPVSEIQPKATYVSARCRFTAVSAWLEGAGLEHVVDAFAQAYRINPGIELHLVGCGPLEWRLRERVGLAGLQRAVVFQRTRNLAHVSELLSNSDVYLHHVNEKAPASTYEWTDQALPVASACGLPVIATRSGSAIDHLIDGENGFLVRTDDPETYARLMVQLAGREDLRAQLGRAGRARAGQELDEALLAGRWRDRLMTWAGPRERVLCTDHTAARTP